MKKVFAQILSGIVALFINFIPVTPQGIGFGEVAFSQVIAWLTNSSDTTAYGSIVLTKRVLTALTLLPAVLLMSAIRRRNHIKGNNV